jgi:uncharacterized membrane protein HdeD (DUF308 family)
MVLKRLISKRWTFSVLGVLVAGVLCLMGRMSGGEFVMVFGACSAVLGVTETVARLPGAREPQP